MAAGQTNLLGRSVGELSGESRADHRGIARIGRFRDAEIDQLGAIDVAIGQDDVVR